MKKIIVKINGKDYLSPRTGHYYELSDEKCSRPVLSNDGKGGFKAHEKAFNPPPIQNSPSAKSDESKP